MYYETGLKVVSVRAGIKVSLERFPRTSPRPTSIRCQNRSNSAPCAKLPLLTLHSILNGSSFAAPRTFRPVPSPQIGSYLIFKWKGGLLAVPCLFVASQQYRPDIRRFTPCKKTIGLFNDAPASGCCHIYWVLDEKDGTSVFGAFCNLLLNFRKPK